MAHSHELESIRDFPKITSAASALGLPSTFVTLDYLADSKKKKKKLPASKGNAFEMPGILGKKENAFGAAFPAS